MIAPFSARKNPAWAQRLTLTTELTPTDSGKTVGWRQGEDESCAKQTTCEGAVLDDTPLTHSALFCLPDMKRLSPTRPLWTFWRATARIADSCGRTAPVYIRSSSIAGQSGEVHSSKACSKKSGQRPVVNRFVELRHS